MADPRPSRPDDVENGLRFSHVVEMQTKQQVTELAASFYALLETMVASGQVALDDYERRRQTTLRHENERIRSAALVVLDSTPDKYALADLPEIDCEARLPLCHARCCKFVFPLSTQDLDERIVQWEYGRPYQIAHRSNGYCLHSEPHTGRCTVYEHRPATCRTYDCRTDQRIWVDFENRVPAP